MYPPTLPYPKEFRDDVVRVARNREPGVELSQIAKAFLIHSTTHDTWIKKADIEDGERTGTTSAQPAELRESKKPILTLEQEVEVLRRAAAYFSQTHLPRKWATRSSVTWPLTESKSR